MSHHKESSSSDTPQLAAGSFILKKLSLSVAELSLLVPFLADDSFMPTFGFWRDFHPSRTLHRVNWSVAAIVNEIAGHDLANLKIYDRLDETGKRAHLDRILEWCGARASK